MSPLAITTRVAAEVMLAKQEGHEKGVFVRGDAHVNYGKVIQAMVLLQQAGVEHVGLMTKPPSRVG